MVYFLGIARFALSVVTDQTSQRFMNCLVFTDKCFYVSIPFSSPYQTKLRSYIPDNNITFFTSSPQLHKRATDDGGSLFLIPLRDVFQFKVVRPLKKYPLPLLKIVAVPFLVPSWNYRSSTYFRRTKLGCLIVLSSNLSCR